MLVSLVWTWLSCLRDMEARFGERARQAVNTQDEVSHGHPNTPEGFRICDGHRKNPLNPKELINSLEQLHLLNKNRKGNQTHSNQPKFDYQ